MLQMEVREGEKGEKQKLIAEFNSETIANRRNALFE